MSCSLPLTAFRAALSLYCPASLSLALFLSLALCLSVSVSLPPAMSAPAAVPAFALRNGWLAATRTITTCTLSIFGLSSSTSRELPTLPACTSVYFNSPYGQHERTLAAYLEATYDISFVYTSQVNFVTDRLIPLRD